MRRGFLNKPSKSSTTRVVQPMKNTSNDTSSTTDGMAIGVPTPVSSAPVTAPAKQTQNAPNESTSAMVEALLERVYNTIQSENMFDVERFPDPLSSRPNEPITTALLHEGTSEALKSIPNFLKTPFEFLDWPYVVKDTQNIGKGLFARETIRPGTLIINERVVAIMPTRGVYNRCLELLFSQLSDNDRQEMFCLHNCRDASVPRVRGILSTNTMSIGRLPGPYTGENAALCRVISRINHSCCPNAYWSFDIDTLSMSIYASQTIAKDQQIFITYTSLFHSREERQTCLLTNYSFTCACPSCSLPPQESMRSDIRRKLLYAEDQKLDTDVSQGNYPFPDDSTISNSKRVIDMMENENAYDKTLAVFHCMQLCAAYCMLGDRKGAVQWARKGVAFGETFRTGVGALKEYMEAPEKSLFWKLKLQSPRG